MIVLHVSTFVLCGIGFMRCGTESAQCISTLSFCDGINDCVNGWDETLDNCYSAEEQLRFADDSKNSSTLMPMQMSCLV